jgi:hypothetical protein
MSDPAKSALTFKRFNDPDLANFGDGNVGLFDFEHAKYLWSDLRKDESWIVGLDDPQAVVVAVLDGSVEVFDDKNRLLATVPKDGIFAVYKNRRIKATSDSRLFAAPLSTASVSWDDGTAGGSVLMRGGSVLMRGGSILMRGGSVMMRGGSVMMRGDTIVL